MSLQERLKALGKAAGEKPRAAALAMALGLAAMALLFFSELPAPAQRSADAPPAGTAADYQAGLEARLLGPAPANIVKINERYRYRLTLACPNTKRVRELVAELLRRAQADKENKGVSVFADVDPLD